MSHPKLDRKPTTRASLWCALLFRLPVLTIALLVGFASAADYLWDEFIGSSRPKLVEIIVWVHWYWWLVIGLAVIIFMFVEHAYKLIHQAETERDFAHAKMTETPPNVSAQSYGTYHGQEGYGLVVANPGYAARNVHIPNAAIGVTNCELEFPRWMGQLLIHDQNQLFRAWIKKPDQTADGAYLGDLMDESGIEGVRFVIKYQDGQDRWHQRKIYLKRNKRDGSGFSLISGEHEPIPVPPSFKPL